MSDLEIVIGTVVVVLFLVGLLAGIIGNPFKRKDPKEYKAFGNLFKILVFPYSLGVYLTVVSRRLFDDNERLYNFCFGDFTAKPKFKKGDILVSEYRSSKVKVLFFSFRKLTYYVEDITIPPNTSHTGPGPQHPMSYFNIKMSVDSISLEEEAHWIIDEEEAKNKVLKQEEDEWLS